MLANSYHTPSFYLAISLLVASTTPSFWLAIWFIHPMKFLYYSQRKRVLLTSYEVAKLYEYLCECNMKAFAGINDFTSVSKDREYLYHWHLVSLIKRVARKLLVISHSIPLKRHSLSLAEPEIMVVKVCLQRVDSLVFDKTLEKTLLKQLRK